jgi:Bifunctional DNA primase/polymerase, N-terminal
MAIPENNRRLDPFRRLSANSGTETIYNSWSDFPQLPDYVLLAASRGWRIFPSPGRCWVEGIGIEDATNVLSQLGQWADDLSGFHWSLATGPESGVFALEAEEPYGLSSLRGLSQLDWPETLYSTSHNYMVAFWRYPAGMRAIDAGRIEIAPGLTVRADGESVVLPPHDSGRWPDLNAPVLESPAWLNEYAFEPAEPDPPIQETRHFSLIRGGLYWRGRTPSSD